MPDSAVEAEVERARERYEKNPRLLRYFDSERGRNFIRSTLRRSRVVERLRGQDEIPFEMLIGKCDDL